MKIKYIVKNIFIVSIIGIILGAITEYVLILDIKWLINITQSFLFWGLIMIVTAFLSKTYILSMINPILNMTAMSTTYYLIRLFNSGYTNWSSWFLFVTMGITASVYIGNLIYCIKEKIINKKIKSAVPKCNLIFMTISGILFTVYFFKHIVFNNLSYGIFIGIFVGLIIGTVVGILWNRANNKKIHKEY